MRITGLIYENVSSRKSAGERLRPHLLEVVVRADMMPRDCSCRAFNLFGVCGSPDR
jgi:hypothetical protein